MTNKKEECSLSPLVGAGDATRNKDQGEVDKGE